MVYARRARRRARSPASTSSLFGHADRSPASGRSSTMALAGTLGYLVGSIVGWWIGRYGGRPLRRAPRAAGSTSGPSGSSAPSAGSTGASDWAVLLGRVTPVVRSFVSIPAGVFRMPLGRYTLLTLVGSAIWCFALAGIGWALGSELRALPPRFRLRRVRVVAGAVLLALVPGTAGGAHLDSDRACRRSRSLTSRRSTSR